MSVGRNDPCPCGSGKKYKKCCMNKAMEEETKRARQHRFFEQKYELSQQVHRFLDEALSYAEQRAAKHAFRQAIRQKKHSEMLEPLETLWYLFVHRFPNGMRGVEWFQREKGRRLSLELQNMLDRWVQLVPRLVQFIDRREDGGVVVDRLTGETLFLPFSETMPDVVPWGGMFAFLEPFDGGYYIQGAASIAGPDGVTEAEEQVRFLLQETNMPYEKLAFSHFLDIVDACHSASSLSGRRTKTVEQWTVVYDTPDARNVLRQLERHGIVIVDEETTEAIKGSLRSVTYEYRDDLASGPIYMNELAGFLEGRGRTMTLSTFDADAEQVLTEALKAIGMRAKAVSRSVETHLVPEGVKLLSYHVELPPGEPSYMALVANSAVTLEQILHVPHEEWGGQSVHELALNGEQEKVEQWLRTYEYHTFGFLRQEGSPVMVDTNSIRPRYGLPLSPFVTPKVKRTTSVQVFQRLDKGEYFAMPAEWTARFFGRDLIDFYREKTEGKSEATEYKYRLGITAVAHYLQTTALSSWDELEERHWRQCLAFHYVMFSPDISINQAKQVMSAVHALAKWLDARFQTNHAPVVGRLVAELSEPLLNAVRLLRMYQRSDVPPEMADASWNAMKKAKDQYQVGTFRVDDVRDGEAMLEWLETGGSLRWRFPRSAKPYVKRGMCLEAAFTSAGALAAVQRVYPPQAAPYVDAFARFSQQPVGL
ncbi:SEC-C metal-binding domain-containing protein [Geobacillus sp. LEMMY01]|uniref:SEC-C metal-binding domain-containing protein n=1 Tax=Geobacillus sp. LEMMY01 TaxID=1954237 RepID=UPI0009ABE59D|nr:SEC-C metal-binding domain-containing protein [Geobacillus sp. LEMMY01]OPX02648.1 preprotein translocase subunit SecA [Geobacillus sp. LEMMY01]